MSPTKLFIAIIMFGGVASAQTDDGAESFKKGQSLLKSGRVHDACQAFEASDRAAPSVDTELALATCYEQDGKTVAAARLLRSVSDTDPNVTRRTASIAKAAKLEARAPKLRFAIDPMPAGLVITVDGAEVPTSGDVPVDLGPHEVIGTAPGYRGHASAPVDREKQILDVVLRMEPTGEATKPMPAAAAAEAAAPATAEGGAAMTSPSPAGPVDKPASPDHRKRNGIIVGASGVAVAVGAAIVWSLSSSKFDDEHKLCPMSSCASNADLAKAHSILDDARNLRGVSIGMGIAGAALIGAGAYLVLTPHKEEPRVSVHVEPGGAGVAYTARF
jgi:nitrogen fixation-related uncharacterized protein